MAVHVRTIVLIFASLLLFVSAAPAQDAPKAPDAKLDGNQILKKMDEVQNGYDDIYYEGPMTVVKENGDKKSYGMTTTQKGGMRLVRFTTGEVKGMAILAKSRNKVWIYMPGYKKSRRVAPHAMKQSFGGSDFSNDDISSVAWTDIWEATLEKEDDKLYYLNCKPKPGAEASYASLKIQVAKKSFLQMRTDYYDDKGRYVKYWINSEHKDWPGGFNAASLLEIGDPNTGHKTFIKINEFKINQGLKDRYFSRKQLEWGR